MKMDFQALLPAAFDRAADLVEDPSIDATEIERRTIAILLRGFASGSNGHTPAREAAPEEPLPKQQRRRRPFSKEPPTAPPEGTASRKVWNFLKDHKGAFTANQITKETGVNRNIARVSAARWVAPGLVRRTEGPRANGGRPAVSYEWVG